MVHGGHCAAASSRSAPVRIARSPSGICTPTPPGHCPGPPCYTLLLIVRSGVSSVIANGRKRHGCLCDLFVTCHTLFHRNQRRGLF